MGEGGVGLTCYRVSTSKSYTVRFKHFNVDALSWNLENMAKNDEDFSKMIQDIGC
jgi:hypothetical protein